MSDQDGLAALGRASGGVCGRAAGAGAGAAERGRPSRRDGSGGRGGGGGELGRAGAARGCGGRAGRAGEQGEQGKRAGGRTGEWPPPSRPRAPVTHMRARALSGSSRLGDTSRRARRLGQPLPASGSATRKRPSRRRPGLEHKGKKKTSSRPALPKRGPTRSRGARREDRRGGGTRDSRGVWEACALAPPGVHRALLRLFLALAMLAFGKQVQVSPVRALPPR